MPTLSIIYDGRFFLITLLDVFSHSVTGHANISGISYQGFYMTVVVRHQSQLL